MTRQKAAAKPRKADPVRVDTRTISRTLNCTFAAELATVLDLVRFPAKSATAGSYLLHAGEAAPRLPLVLHGELEVRVHLRSSGALVIPITFGQGEIALLSTLFGDTPAQIDILAAKDSIVRWLPRLEIETALALHGRLAVLAVRFMAQRLRDAQMRERAWLERGIEGRVCVSLVRLAQESQRCTDGTWLIEATHERLALQLNVSRPKLSLQLERLAREGLLRLGRGRIQIVDLPTLAAR
jgi:CRP/FNR family transcriptional regulator, cyclic AMP receptor protein